MDEGRHQPDQTNTPPNLRATRQFETKTPVGEINSGRVVLSVDNSPTLSTRALDAALPKPAERRVYIGFPGAGTARLKHLIESGTVDPTEIKLLAPQHNRPGSESVVADTAEQLRTVADASVEIHQVAWPSDPVSRFVGVYDILSDIFSGDDTISIEEVVINLTAAHSSVELVVFATVATYVLDHSDHRRAISIYHVESTETDQGSAAKESQSNDRTSRLRDDGVALNAYLTREFKSRLDRIYTLWEEANQDMITDPTAAGGRIEGALEELEEAIEMLERDLDLTQIHALEEALWELTDQIDGLESTAQDTDSLPELVRSLRNAIDRFDDAVTTLHSVVREHRREFRKQHVEGSNVSESLDAKSESQLLSVQQLPLPPFPTLSDEQERLLRRLAKDAPFDSVSALSRVLYEDAAVDISLQSYRSKVQYNVRTLEARGYVVREPQGRSYRTMLAPMGKVWIQTRGSESDGADAT